MAKAKTLVGLDVHATKIVAAVLDAETGAVADVHDGRRERDRGGVLRGTAETGAGRV